METQFASNSKKTIVAIVIALILGAAALWYTGFLKIPGSSTSTNGMPSLEHAVSYSAGFPEEGKVILEKNVEALRDHLRNDPENWSAWLDLAIQYKTAGDIDAAIEIWEYMAEKQPTAVPYYNLGTTYHLEKKDFARAEEHFTKALEIDPGSAIGYLGLHEIYRYSYKQDTTLAVDTLEQGIEKVEGTSRIDLYSALAAYYVEKGERAKAIDAFTTARDMARMDGNTNLARILDAEIARLR